MSNITLYGIIEILGSEDKYRPFANGGTFRLCIQPDNAAVFSHIHSDPDFTCNKWLEITQFNARILFTNDPLFNRLYERKILLSFLQNDPDAVWGLYMEENPYFIAARTDDRTCLPSLTRLLLSGIPELKKVSSEQQ